MHYIIFRFFIFFIGFFLIFNEQTSLNWWCGISLIILGLFFVNYTPRISDSVPSLKSKNE